MKVAVVSCSNGTFKIESEWTDNLPSARINFWNCCAAFENAPDVIKAKVAIFDENLDIVDGKVQEILHNPVSKSQPENQVEEQIK